MSRTTNYRLVQGMGLVSKYCLILALVCPWGVNGQGVVYVDSDANGVGDGSSWPDAFTSLQDALLAWSPGASVWVAEGVYHPDQGQGVSLGDKEAVFQLPAGMNGCNTARQAANTNLAKSGFPKRRGQRFGTRKHTDRFG